MRKFLIAAAIATASAVAMPAAAQPDYGRNYGYHQGRDIARQLQNLDARIRQAADRRRISQREAHRLLREVDQLEFLYDRYRRNGLTRWEHQDLQFRIQRLRQRLQFDRWDGRRDDDDRRRWSRDHDDDDDRWDRRGRRDRDHDDDDDDDDDD